jgi:DNA polymerase III psi subunit
MSEYSNFLYQQLFATEELYVIPEQIQAPDSPATMVAVTPEATVSINPPLEIPMFTPKHRVIILVNNITMEDEILLAKILTAVKLNLEDVELLKLDALKNVNIRAALSQSLISQLITFGIPLSKIKLEIPLVPYQIREIKNIRFLYSDELHELKEDVTKKKALWKALQEMFQ